MTRLLWLLGPLTLLFVWWVVTTTGAISSLYLPTLPETGLALLAAFRQDNLVHLGATLYRTLSSFLAAALAATTVGLLLGSSKKLYRALEFLIDFFRSLPAPALFPLFLLFFGIGDAAKIAVAFFVAFWIVLINTVYGVWNASQLRKQVGQIFRATPWQKFIYITIPDALPQIFVGLRIALSLALILVVVTEMFIGTRVGLGQEIFNSYASYRIPQMYAAILLVGLLGYALNKGFIFLERKLIHWTGW